MTKSKKSLVFKEDFRYGGEKSFLHNEGVIMKDKYDYNITVDEFEDKIEGLFETACNIDGRGRTGGILCVADSNGILLLIPQGEILNEDKRAQYNDHCQEKAFRLLRNKGHISSWQSRDCDNKKYGGAVLAGSLAFSFSGLSEHVDEAFSATVARRVSNGMTLKRWQNIQRISANPHMGKFGCL